MCICTVIVRRYHTNSIFYSSFITVKYHSVVLMVAIVRQIMMNVWIFRVILWLWLSVGCIVRIVSKIKVSKSVTVLLVGLESEVWWGNCSHFRCCSGLIYSKLISQDMRSAWLPLQHTFSSSLCQLIQIYSLLS